MSFYGAFLETDPAKKDTAWMTEIVSQIRMQSYRSLYDPFKAKKYRDIILSNQNLDYVKRMFKKPEKLEEDGFEFISISVMEKIKNILIGEKLQAEIKAYVNAKDPSMERMKKEDKNLLKNKRLIEGQVNSLKKDLGLPPEKITNDDFNGNYDQFDQMGMDETDDSQIENFFETFYQLDIEADLQKWVNHIFSVNEIDQYTNDFVIDIMAIKTIAIQQYINQINGCTEVRRLNPEDVFIIKGQNKINQKGDVAVGYYEEVTVGEFIKRCGSNFDFFTQFKRIFDSIFYNTGLRITGAMLSPFQLTGNYSSSGDDICIGDPEATCSYQTLMNYKVKLGYIEVKSVDAKRFKKFTSLSGNEKVYEIDPLKKDSKDYESINFNTQERTYKCNFLATSLMDQYVYNHGLVFHQDVDGVEDQYSNFTIKYIQFDGKTIAQIAEAYIKLAQEAFTKLRFLLRRAMPDGRSYNAEAMKDLTKILTGKEGTAVSIATTFEMLDNSINELFVPPRNRDGSLGNIQGGVNHDIKRSLDTKFKSYVEIISWAVSMIKQDIGITDLRNADEPKTNDVNKLEQSALSKSTNATYYIDYMLDYAYKNTAITNISFLQDILLYKDRVAYKYVQNVLGEEGCKRLLSLPKLSVHRMDIFVTSFANYMDRVRVLKDTQTAFEKGLIDYQTKMLVDSIDDFRKAQKVLIHQEEKRIRDLQKEQKAKNDFEIKLDDHKTKNQLLLIDRKGSWELKKGQAQAQGYIDASEVNAKVKLGIEDKKGENEKNKKVLENELEKQKETYS